MKTSDVEKMLYLRSGTVNELAHHEGPSFIPATIAGRSRDWDDLSLLSLTIFAMNIEAGLSASRSSQFASKVFHHLSDRPKDEYVSLEFINGGELGLNIPAIRAELKRRVANYKPRKEP